MSQLESELQTFDDEWALGDPIAIEARFREMLVKATADNHKSIYLQLLTQIALASALQQKFNQAHETLDLAEQELTADHELAAARVLLERGRVFHQADRLEEAKQFYRQAFDRGSAGEFDFLTIDAAHMLAIIGESVDEKIRWNRLAIELAKETDDQRAHRWMGSLSHNLGQFYFEAKRYDESLLAYQEALVYREQEAYEPNVRVAKWAIARSLRYLGRDEESLQILMELVETYSTIAEADHLDMPAAMLPLARGLVYEELTEAFAAKASKYAALALDDLAKDPMFAKTELIRLERLHQLKNWTAGN